MILWSLLWGLEALISPLFPFSALCMRWRREEDRFTEADLCARPSQGGLAVQGGC